MRRKKRHGIKVSLIIITSTSLVLTLTALAYYLMQYRDADLLNEQIAEIAFGDEEKTGIQTPNGSIDHAALLAVNGDYAGWLEVEGTDISYPVVQSKQELFYLRRDFNKNKSVAGTVFMDYQNNKNFTDTNTMLYGHHMRNGSMFAALKKFQKSGFFDANKLISVSTPNGDYRYEIFAVYEVKASSVPYMPGMLDNNELAGFLAQIKKMTLYSRETDIDAQDRILTLSTCGYIVDNARIIVHAKLIAE